MADHPPVEVLEAITRMADLAWFQVDADRRMVRWSEAAARLTGFSAEEALNAPCVAVVRCHRCLAGCRVMELGAADGHTTVYTRSGDELRVRKVGVALRDEAGEITGTVEFLVRLDSAGAPLDRGIDAMSRALNRVWLAADDQYRIVDFSGDLSALTGLSREALLGRPLALLLGEDLWGPSASLRGALDRGERREGRFALLETHGGPPQPVSVSAGPGGDGRVHVMLRPQDEQDARGYQEFGRMVGRSPAMLRLFRLIEVLGDSEATVLISGESGTGKELVAHALHAHSPRAAGPFVAINCAALPGDLLESELFGHVRGAFTGAVRDRPGRFEAAAGGTLFLDEIGDLPLSLQAKLLRVLEDHSYQAVGDDRTRTANVRVIAATNVQLREAVTARRFREDLYYRLRVLPIDIPPLRERRADLEPLIRHFLARAGVQQGRAVQLAPSAMRALLDHDWPGNVRELENALAFATAVCTGQTIHLDDLPPEIQAQEQSPAPSSIAPAAVESGEAAALRAALEEAHYKRDEAARLLGISRTTLWRKMKKLGFDG